MKQILIKIVPLPLLAVAAMANTTAKMYYPPTNIVLFNIYLPWPVDLFIDSVILVAVVYGVYKLGRYLWNKFGDEKGA